MSDRLLFPQLTEGHFVHQAPVVKLCKGLLAQALDGGFERLEVLAPREGSPIAEIRAYRGASGTRYFELPASMHQSVVRRFKAMAKMRRARPLDTQGVIQLDRAQGKPVPIRVTTSPRADGRADMIMNLVPSNSRGGDG